jgi:hypothetical protein
MATYAKFVSFTVMIAVLVVAFNATAERARRRERIDDRRDARIEAVTGWNRLGERWIQGAVDRDTIVVTAAQGAFTRIMFRVEHSAAELFNIVVTFGDGTTYSPPTRLVFGRGQTMRVIDLPGGARVIRRVDFAAGNLPGGGRAQVELWAR